MALFERFVDLKGGALLGWLAPDVIYAQFASTISADVGARFARRWSSLIGNATDVHFFLDSSRVSSYTVEALTSIGEAMRAKREQLGHVVILRRDAALPAATAHLDTLQSLQYVNSKAELDVCLRKLVSTDRLYQLVMPVDGRQVSAVRSTLVREWAWPDAEGRRRPE